jgi:hypothetical protein
LNIEPCARTALVRARALGVPIRPLRLVVSLTRAPTGGLGEDEPIGLVIGLAWRRSRARSRPGGQKGPVTAGPGTAIVM